MRLKPLSILFGVLVVAAVRPAAADTILTGSVGGTFGGDVDSGQASYGAAIGFMGNIFGVEAEATYTPHFFGGGSSGSSNVTTLMGNLVLGAGVGNTARIYASGGVGLMKFRVTGVGEFFDVSRNDFGMNAGAGLMVGLGGTLGLRGDVRYFRNLSSNDNNLPLDLGGFHYWRAAGGLTLKF